MDSHSNDVHEALLAAAIYHLTQTGTAGQQIEADAAAWSHFLGRAGPGRLQKASMFCEYRVIDRTPCLGKTKVRLRHNAGHAN